jgi:hypothetical protein
MTDPTRPDSGSRRRALGSLAAGAGAGAVLLRPPPATAADGWFSSRPSNVRKRVRLNEGPVDVPASFVGLHVNRWPSGSPVSSQPTYGYGTVRSLNYDPSEDIGIFWRDTNPARGKYNWRKLDQWVDTFHGLGKRLIYSFYGTPTWATTRPTVRDPYTQFGGNSRPKDFNDVAVFVKELVKRYNGGPVRKLSYIEVWNEPDFIGTAYWLDTAEDLATLARVIHESAKSVDKDIRILGPAWVGIDHNTPKIEAFAKASDGAGGSGRKWIDAFAWHFYDYKMSIAELVKQTNHIKDYMRRAGWEGVPLYMTEIGGWEWTATRPSIEDKATQIQRWLMVMAATGHRLAALYMHDTMPHLGDPSRTPALAEAIDLMHRELAGRTILEATMLEDDRIWLKLAGGKQLIA